ncbi:MAG: hypothetical protein NC124_20055 [Clostridium sp.]|nr:hypothetical protein [Clostridium sp.]
MPDNYIANSERDCLGTKKTEEVLNDVKALDRRLSEFQQNVYDTNGRFGARIGKLEAREEVREEQHKYLKERLDGITKDMADFQKENKNSITELRKEHKESMDELRKGNKEILDSITPLVHKMDDIERLEEDVEELKEKPVQTWEHIKKQGIGWIIVLILGIIAVALGLGQYL